MKDFNAIMIKLHGELYQNGITDDVQPYAESSPRFTKGRKSYDFRPILLPFPTKFVTISQNLSECFYDFRFTTCGYDVFFVRRYENRSIYPGRAPIR